MFALAAALAFATYYHQKEARPYELKYSQLYKYAEAEQVGSAVFRGQEVVGMLRPGAPLPGEGGRLAEEPAPYTAQVREDNEALLALLLGGDAEVDYESPTSLWLGPLLGTLPIMLLLLLFWVFIYRQMQAGGNRAMSFGKSRARLFSENHPKSTFEDVAGADEPKQELQEIIAFLKDPRKFTRLGAKIPKGVLLYGPPGCGKTLLARAIAGEAGVPFYSISGSDFVEMFVGVGASRVRDLFEQARRAAATSTRGCIIFIDEIDAVGRQRFAGIGGGHDEREQTLNQLLSEMDGFDAKEGVILIAATNRPDVLDAALLRPGRFDRQVEVYAPDLTGRERILGLYVGKVVVDDTVNVKEIARATPGFSGADLANLVNEAALLAARRDREAVTKPDFLEATERVMAGPERKSRVINEREKRIIAFHEAGHALLALLIDEADPLHKVSVIPRGGTALGYTLQLPLEDRYLVTRKELLGRMTVMLGGRVAEELVFNEMTTGAQNDLEHVSASARRMVTEFGMSDKLGPVTYRETPEKVFLGRDLTKDKHYSEKVAVDIDAEITRIVSDCHERARSLLALHRKELDKLATELIEREVLSSAEVQDIVGIHVDATTHKVIKPGEEPSADSAAEPAEPDEEPKEPGSLWGGPEEVGGLS